MDLIHDPENNCPANQIYVVVSRDENGNEGIVAATFDGTSMPFVFIDKKMIDMVKPIAQRIANETNKKMYIVKYTNKEDIEEIRSW